MATLAELAVPARLAVRSVSEPRMEGRPLFTLALSLAAVNVSVRFQNSESA